MLFFICSIRIVFSIMNLHLFLKCITSELSLLAHCGLTCVMSVIFCAIKCTVTEVASGIVNASNKEIQMCACDTNLYDTDETNSILEMRLTLYSTDFEEIKSSCLNVADFFF